jgi:hypothetical protein
MERRKWSAVIGLVAVAIIIVSASAVYGGKHEVLTPLLIDLEDWKAEDAQGMSMDMETVKMVNAFRTYQTEEKEINAGIMICSKAIAQSQMQRMGKMEFGDVKMEFTEMDGFKVYTNYDKEEDQGYILVMLSQKDDDSGMFMFNFSGMDEEEALKVAKKFDWKKLKKEVEKIM